MMLITTKETEICSRPEVDTSVTKSLKCVTMDILYL